MRNTPVQISHGFVPTTERPDVSSSAQPVAPDDDQFAAVRGTKRKASELVSQDVCLALDVPTNQPRGPSRPRADGQNAFIAAALPLEMYLQVFKQVGNVYDLLCNITRVSVTFRENVHALRGDSLRALLPVRLHPWIPSDMTFVQLMELLRAPHGHWQAETLRGGGTNAGHPPVFSASGNMMVTTHAMEDVHVWRREKERLGHHGVLNDTIDASCALFSPDDTRIATAGGITARLQFFDAASLRCVGTLERVANRVIFLDPTTVAAEEHETHLVRIIRLPATEGDVPTVIAILDVATDLPRENGKPHQPYCAVSATGRTLVAAAGDTLRVWSVSNLVHRAMIADPPTVAPDAQYKAHEALIDAIAFAPEDDRFASMDRRHVLNFWSTQTDTLTVQHESVLKFRQSHGVSNRPRTLVYAPSNMHAAVTLGDGKFALISDPGPAAKRLGKLNGIGPLFSVDGRFVTAIVGASFYDKNATVWRLDSKRPKPINHLSGVQPASTLVGSPDGQFIVATDPSCHGIGVWRHQALRPGSAGFVKPQRRLEPNYHSSAWRRQAEAMRGPLVLPRPQQRRHPIVPWRRLAPSRPSERDRRNAR